MNDEIDESVVCFGPADAQTWLMQMGRHISGNVTCQKCLRGERGAPAKVRFTDHPDKGGRGRLDLATGERHF